MNETSTRTHSSGAEQDTQENNDLKNRLRSEYMSSEEQQEEERQAEPLAVRRTGTGKILGGAGMVALSIILTSIFSDTKEFLVFYGLSLIGTLTIEIGVCNITLGKRWDDLSLVAKGTLCLVALVGTIATMVISLVWLPMLFGSFDNAQSAIYIKPT